MQQKAKPIRLFVKKFKIISLNTPYLSSFFPDP